MTYTVAVGNAFDGISLHGLFNNMELAANYAEKTFEYEDWHVVPINEEKLSNAS